MSRSPVLHAVALLEAIHASARIYQLLLAGEERMALGADIDAQFLLGRAGFKSLAANETDDRLAVLRMYALFHGFHLTFRYAHKTYSLVTNGKNYYSTSRAALQSPFGIFTIN